MMLRVYTFILASVCLVGIEISAAHAETIFKEYSLKAAYLYNFAVLTTWPDDKEKPHFNLCYSGSTDTRAGLEKIADKNLNSIPIKITHLLSVSAVKQCELLFLAQSSRLDPEHVLTETLGLPILTVTDDVYLSENSELVILIRPEGKRLVFEVNHDAASKKQLEISSRLLRLSR